MALRKVVAFSSTSSNRAEIEPVKIISEANVFLLQLWLCQLFLLCSLIYFRPQQRPYHPNYMPGFLISSNLVNLDGSEQIYPDAQRNNFVKESNPLQNIVKWSKELVNK